MKHKGYCVKILYGELEALEVVLILSCIFGKREEPSISKGFDNKASQKTGRYDDKKVSYLPLINLVPFSTRGRWSVTGWGAVRRVGRYNKNKSFQWKIENGKSLPSSSAEGWRSSRLRKTSWVPELRSRTTSAIHPYIHNYPSSGLRPPSPARGEGNALYLHTSEPRRCA